METEKTLKIILKKLERIEEILAGQAVAEKEESAEGLKIIPSKPKLISLPELARFNSTLNGQQKVTLIVGYFEKILDISPINRSEINEGWGDGKFKGTFATTLIHRAVKDGLIRDLKGSYDLSQTGEEFFNDLITNNKNAEHSDKENKL